MSNRLKGERLLRSALLGGAAIMASSTMAIVVSTLVSTPAAAQDYTTGAIQGRVTDRAGKAISGAKVTVTSDAQGFTRTLTTSGSGGFRATGLPPGSYTVGVVAPGYDSLSDQKVSVSAGSTGAFDFVVGGGSVSEEIVVSGTRETLSFSETTTGVNVDVEDLVKTVPIGRNLTALTLLAPGVAQGDSAFGNLSSLSGASVAENAYYLNGLNITNFDNYLGSAQVPFEFYKSVEVKTGGYPAEFGRAIGGIVNAVTKSGSNEFEANVHVNWTPDALRSDAKDTFQNRNSLDEAETSSVTLDVGGPIIKDHLFFYGIAEFRNNTFRDASITNRNQVEDKSSDPFFGFKIDGYLTDDHHFEFTYFDTDRTTNRITRDFNPTTNVVSNGVASRTTFDDGGASFVAKYTGVLAPWVTISGAYGQSDDKFQVLPESGLSVSTDNRSGNPVSLSAQTTGNVDLPYTTQRKFYRADADFFFNILGDHHVRLGWETENLALDHVSVRTGPAVPGPAAFPGGVTYGYFRCPTPASVDPVCAPGNSAGLVSGSDYVDLDYFNTGGSFRAKNIAYYIQDEWKVTKALSLNLGVRLDQFNNFTANGSQFVDFNKLFAPRAGFSYDLFGNGKTRLFGNFGLYYLPVASNTAFRQGAQEYFFSEYWTFSSIGANGVPVLGTQIQYPTGTTCPFSLRTGGAGLAGACDVTGRGDVQDPTASISRNLKATKEREILVGIQHELTDLWTLGVSYTRRNLRETAEDSALDAAILAYCDNPANGVNQTVTACSSIWTGFHQYTIINPGRDQTVQLNSLLPGETTPRTVTFTAAQLGYPKATRTYDAVQFTFDRKFDGHWAVSGSYTWSKSRGNSEGYVKSDNGQDDAGITTDFDQPGLTDGSYGPLPNDRTHQFKIWGSYALTQDFTVGFNAIVSSPRKFGCLGRHPTDLFAAQYGAASWYCDLDGVPGRELTPRGSVFKSDWQKNLDLSLRYNVELPTGTTMTLRGDVFNILNFDAALDFEERGTLNSGARRTTYRQPTVYQAPRSVRIGLDIGF